MVKGEPRGFDASDLFPYFICIVYLGGETSNILGEMFTPKKLWEMIPNLTCAYFSNGLVQPPTRYSKYYYVFTSIMLQKGSTTRINHQILVVCFAIEISICLLFFLGGGLYLKDQDYSGFFVAILICCIPKLPSAPDISRVLVVIDVVGVMFSSQIHTAYASRIYTPTSVYVFAYIYIHIFDMCIYTYILSYMELFNNR